MVLWSSILCYCISKALYILAEREYRAWGRRPTPAGCWDFLSSLPLLYPRSPCTIKHGLFLLQYEWALRMGRELYVESFLIAPWRLVPQTFRAQKLKGPGLYNNLYSRANLVHGHPRVSEVGFVVFVFVFLRKEENITRLTRAQLVEEGIAQSDHGEVFNSLEPQHIGAGIWAC